MAEGAVFAGGAAPHNSHKSIISSTKDNIGHRRRFREIDSDTLRYVSALT